METRQSKRKQKNYRSGDDESKSQRQKIEIVEDSPDEIKITELPIECLERIFKRLNIEDLFNVGLSNKWLNKAANSIFKRKYGKKCVSFRLISPHHWVFFEFGYDRVLGLKTSLQFIRCFGQSISKLEVDFYNASRDQQTFVLEYMQKYCAKSLVEIEFSEINFPINNQMKPFTKVEKLRLYFSDLSENFSQFNRLFPSLRHLELIDIEVKCFTAVHFPHLEHLRTIIHASQEGYFTKQNGADLLEQNPQLQSFHGSFNSKISLNELMSMVSGNPLITNLTVESDGMKFKRMKATLNKFAKALPALTELCFKSVGVPADVVISLIRQFKSLKVFKFEIDDDSQFDHLRARLNDVPGASVDNRHGNCTITME